MTMRTKTGIEYEEIHPPEFSVGRDGLTGKRTFKIAWEDQDRFWLEFFPPPTTTRTGKNIVPDMATFPGRNYLIAQNLTFTAFDTENPGDPDANGVATCPSGALVEVSYSTAEFNQNSSNNDNEDDQEGQAIYSMAIQVGGEYFQLPAHSLKWEMPDLPDDDPQKANQTEDLNAAKLIPTVEFVLTFHRMPELPLEVILDKIGRVNSDYEKNFKAPAETLLFVGCNATRKVTTEGADAWEVEYRFSMRCVKWLDRPDFYFPDITYPIAYAGWNHFIDPRDGKWRKLMTKSNDYIYNTTENFDALFYPDADAEYSSSSSGHGF